MSEVKEEFSKAQVGDKVWSFPGGEGVIISTTNGTVYSIKVDHGDENLTYTIGGKHSATDEFPTLYWGQPTMELVPPPKRKVKKWVNLYRTLDSSKVVAGNFRSTKVEAENNYNGYPLVYLKTVEVEMEVVNATN